METNIFTAKYFFNCACRDFGLEDKHTIAIGKIVECKEGGYLEATYADDLAKLIYNDARLLWGFQEEADEPLEYTEPNEDEEPEWEEPDWGDEGFDPYMGCYTGDC